MPIRLECPRCKRPLAIPTKKAGSYVNCPSCKGRFWVPADELGRADDSRSATDGDGPATATGDSGSNLSLAEIARQWATTGTTATPRPADAARGDAPPTVLAGPAPLGDSSVVEMPVAPPTMPPPTLDGGMPLPQAIPLPPQSLSATYAAPQPPSAPPATPLPVPPAMIATLPPMRSLPMPPAVPPPLGAPIPPTVAAPPAVARPAPPAPTAAAGRKVAKFITAEAATSTLAPAPDGKLPELHLDEGQAAEAAKAKSSGSNPLLLALLLCFSVVMSIVFALVGPSQDGSEESLVKSEARRKIEESFFAKKGKPLEPYQLLLRDAQQAHNRGDLRTERQDYQQVLKLLRAERETFQRGLTGSLKSDQELETYITRILGPG